MLNLILLFSQFGLSLCAIRLRTTSVRGSYSRTGYSTSRLSSSSSTYRSSAFQGFATGAAIGYMAGRSRSYYYARPGYSGSYSFRSEVCEATISKSELDEVQNTYDNDTTLNDDGGTVTVYFECSSSERCCQTDCCSALDWKKIVIAVVCVCLIACPVAYFCYFKLECCCNQKRKKKRVLNGRMVVQDANYPPQQVSYGYPPQTYQYGQFNVPAGLPPPAYNFAQPNNAAVAYNNSGYSNEQHGWQGGQMAEAPQQQHQQPLLAPLAQNNSGALSDQKDVNHALGSYSQPDIYQKGAPLPATVSAPDIALPEAQTTNQASA